MTQLAYPNSNDSTIIVAVSEQLPSIVAAIGRIHFEGNVIPHEWYQKITLHDGKPDLPAIIILAEIVYWYRPIRLLDPQGKPLIQKKFNEDMFQSGASYYENKFGLTKNQVRKALKRLEEAGFIRREYREVVKRGIRLNNVMFIEPVPSKILEITHPSQHQMVMLANENAPSLPTGERVSPIGERVSPIGERVSPVGERVSPVGERVSPVGETNTKTTTETTTETSQDFSKTTTTTTTAALASNKKGSSCSSHELIFDFKLSSLTKAQQQRAAKILEGLDKEIAQQVLDEFNSAIDCGSIKKSKWAWLQSVAKSAREGTFIATSELVDRRQAQAQVVAIQAPARKPSQIWKEQREKLLHDGITPADYQNYIAPLFGREDGIMLWLEAPNTFVANWVRAHLPQIEAVMQPCTRLPIRVCIG